MNIELETLSPVHIGNGNEISPMEYWIQESFARINMEGLLQDVAFEPHMESFIKGAASNRYIGQYLPPDLLQRHVAYIAPLDLDARTHLASNPIAVKEFVKSAGRVYIPGSSIKGAVFSALMFHVLSERIISDNFKSRILELLKNFKDKKSYTALLDAVFDDFHDSRDGRGQKGRFYSWIDVEDTALGPPETMLKIYLTHVEGAKGTSTLPIVCEALAPETKFYLKIREKSGFRWSIQDLLSISNTFYRMVWGKTNPRKPPPQDGLLLRLGQGSSAYATSLLLFKEKAGLAKEIYPLKPPRTQKELTAGGNLGWVVLRAAEHMPQREFHFPKVESVSQKPSPVQVKREQTDSKPDFESPDILVKKPSAAEKIKRTEWWQEATLTWNPGKMELTAVHLGKKAICKGKEIIPEALQNRLLSKRKTAVADVEVEAVGNAFRILAVKGK